MIALVLFAACFLVAANGTPNNYGQNDYGYGGYENNYETCPRLKGFTAVNGTSLPANASVDPKFTYLTDKHGDSVVVASCPTSKVYTLLAKRDGFNSFPFAVPNTMVLAVGVNIDYKLKCSGHKAYAKDLITGSKKSVKKLTCFATTKNFAGLYQKASNSIIDYFATI